MKFCLSALLILFTCFNSKGFAQCSAAFSYRAITSKTLQFIYAHVNGLDSTTTFLWTFGDGNGARVENPTYTFPDTGWYNICLRVHNSNCSRDTCVRVHIVNCEAYFTSLYQPTISQPEASAYYFADRSQGEDGSTISSWMVGGDLSSHKNLSWTFHIDDAGPQPVCLTIRNTDNSCISTHCDTFDIHPLCPGASFKYSHKGNECTFYPSTCGHFTKAIWDFGDGTVDSSNAIADSILHNYPSAKGKYYTCLTVDYDSVCKFMAPCTAIYCQTINPGNSGSGAVSPADKHSRGSAKPGR